MYYSQRTPCWIESSGLISLTADAPICESEKIENFCLTFKVFICELPAGFQPISLYNLAIQHIENQKGFSQVSNRFRYFMIHTFDGTYKILIVFNGDNGNLSLNEKT